LHIPDVVAQAWLQPFSTKGDYARSHAISVAAAASLGFITSRFGAANFGRSWVVTPAGLTHLWFIRGLDE
jgi:hypothetical protein